jgi:hypothetical protein
MEIIDRDDVFKHSMYKKKTMDILTNLYTDFIKILDKNNKLEDYQHPKIIISKNNSGDFFNGISSIPAFDIKVFSTNKNKIVTGECLVEFRINTFPENCSTAVISNLNVKHSLRKLGIGTLFFKAAEELCRICLYTQIMCSGIDKESRKIIKKEGFKIRPSFTNIRTGRKNYFALKLIN